VPVAVPDSEVVVDDEDEDEDEDPVEVEGTDGTVVDDDVDGDERWAVVLPATDEGAADVVRSCVRKLRTAATPRAVAPKANGARLMGCAAASEGERLVMDPVGGGAQGARRIHHCVDVAGGSTDVDVAVGDVRN